ncbi:glutaminase A [Rossellomorea aquimaris]|jgi:glutaminase|uniref:Glutaminase n=1 Tax=Rossellomorea aquimaris TaxID=189382 RepID=A0A1J6W6Q9_9BACI|nr:glutaminase A [Rossellomorea aquimaris]OIU72356.1 glutaminase A [Rossellomorea aquimaris]
MSDQKLLGELVDIARAFAPYGKVADYIPALSNQNPDDLAICIYSIGNESYYAGDHLKKFTLQSISKVITLALVLMDNGEDEVFSKVGMEPTGDPFNSIAKLETNKPSKPLNPMINAGALAVTHMIKGDTVIEKWDRLIEFICHLTGQQVTYNEDVAYSELQTANLNRSLCYFMKQHGVITGNVEDLLVLYTKQCAVEMNCVDLAKMGAVFANDGLDPESGRQLITKDVARICKTFMVTCGMYNSSGEFAIKVGIPAKSGVSGGIMGSVPGKCGIGIFGPSLDEVGNSIAGTKLLEGLSAKYSWSIF